MAFQKILLVEGSDDEHVLKHLCGNRGGPEIDEFKKLDGVQSLMESFPVRLKASEEGDIVGMIIDADTDLTSRWHSLQSRLTKVGYKDVPNIPAPDGTIIDPPINTLLPRAGIWIMPDNKNTGILEDFLKFLVPAESLLFKHVEASIKSIPENERRYSKLAEPKAIIHTWLAWQEEPGKPLGTAITARYLDANVTQVDDIISWLNRLFST